MEFVEKTNVATTWGITSMYIYRVFATTSGLNGKSEDFRDSNDPGNVLTAASVGHWIKGLEETLTSGSVCTATLE